MGIYTNGGFKTVLYLGKDIFTFKKFTLM